MGLLDKIKDVAKLADSGGAAQEQPAQAYSSPDAGAPLQKLQGMFDQSGHLLIHDEDQLVDSVYFPDPTDIDEEEIVDYFEEQGMFASGADGASAEPWKVGKVLYSFDEQPEVAQGDTLAFIPASGDSHAFYGVLYVDDDGDLRFDMRRQHNPAAVVTPADAARYDALRKAVDGLLQTEELFGWTFGAGKRLMEPAYYDAAEIVRQAAQSAGIAAAGAQTAVGATATDTCDAVAQALAVVEAAQLGLPQYVPDASKEKRFADIKTAIGFVKNNYLQPSEGFKLMDESSGPDMYSLTLENARGDVQYTLTTGNRGGSTSLILTATIVAGYLQDGVSLSDLHRVFDAMYQKTILSFFGPGRLCPHISVDDSGKRALIAIADIWFTSEIRRLNDPNLFAQSEFALPTLLANRIDITETMFHDPLVTSTLAALCK